MKKLLMSICLLLVFSGCKNFTNRIEFSDTEILDVMYNDNYIEYTEEQSESIFKIIDSLKWQKEVENNADNNEEPPSILKIIANRTIRKDDNKLMIHSPGTLAFLYYDLDLNTGSAIMGYMALSSIINNLYAKLSTNQLNEIKELFSSGFVYPTLSTGVYIYEESEDIMKPSLTINKDSQFSLVFSSLSSYIGFGTYEVKDNNLYLYTKDGIFSYVFKIKRDELVFVAAKSSTALWLSDIKDGCKFIKQKQLAD